MTAERLRIAMSRVIAVLGVGWLMAVVCGPALASSVPYQDPFAHGVVGLCDRAGHSITSGNIHARPFVWRAVGSVPAPNGYQGAGRKGTLAAYQPRSGADSTEWSGDVLTASSTYTNASHPMAQATGGDESLADFLTAFPPRWDGMIQLRLLYSAPNAPVDQQMYAATDIHISGNTWTVVRGGPPSCTSGSATSAESLLPPPPAQSKHNDAAPYDSPAPNAHQSALPGDTPTPDASAAALAANGSDSTHGSGSSGVAVILVGVSAALVIAASIATVAWRRRQHAT